MTSDRRRALWFCVTVAALDMLEERRARRRQERRLGRAARMIAEGYDDDIGALFGC